MERSAIWRTVKRLVFRFYPRESRSAVSDRSKLQQNQRRSIAAAGNQLGQPLGAGKDRNGDASPKFPNKTQSPSRNARAGKALANFRMVVALFGGGAHKFIEHR